MAHEITKTDGLVLHQNDAWHGLGTIVQEAPTPREALKIANLDWEVKQYPLIARKDAKTGLVVGTHQANYRGDTQTLLGIVGKGYVPIQNTELADFCEALAEGGNVVKCESAGSIRGGTRVWFLLKGESFSVRKKDEVTPYICVSNGHDGWTALRCTPTTVRVVCSNTLHMVIPGKENEGGQLRAAQAKFVCNHTKEIKGRVEDAKKALQLYGRALDTTREYLDALAAKDVNSEQFKQFIMGCYVRDFGAVALKPKNPQEEKQLWRCRQAYHGTKERFEAEQKLAGATLWNAMNAYTGWLQNDNPSNVRDPAKAADARVASRLWGTNATRAHATLAAALALAS